MSWHVLIVVKVNDIISIINKSLPDVDFLEDDLGVLETQNSLIEFSMCPKNNEVDCFILHVRGVESCLDVIKKLCVDTVTTGRTG